MRGADAPETHTHPLSSLVPSSTARQTSVHAGRAARERGPRRGAGRARPRRRRGRRAAPAGRRRHAPTSCASRTPASSSRTTTCRSAAGASARCARSTLTDDNQAEITISVQDGYAPLHEGTTALDPRDLAVGHRQPLHRADARARTPTAKLPDGRHAGDRQDDVDRRPRPALQHARPQDAQGAAAVHPGQRARGTTTAGAQANAATKYFNPALSASRAAGQRGRRQPADAQRLPAQRGQDDRRAGLAPRRPREPRLQREHDRGGDRRRERVVQPGAGAAARHAAQGQHDVRQPARDARRPRRARGRVQAGDEGPRAAS